MAIPDVDASQRKAARVAGFACLFSTAFVIFAHYVLDARLLVRNDVAATAQNIVAHELLFRLTIACQLIYVAGVLVMLTALYALLEPVNRSLAQLAAFCRFAYALMWVVIALNRFDVVRLLSGAGYLSVFEADRLQALARLRLSAASDAYYVGLPFFGLASALWGYLLFKSNYVPKALGAFGLIAGAWCVVCALLFIIIPDFGKILNAYWFDSALGAFEMVTSLWLLFKGLKPYGAARRDRVQ